MTSEWIPCGSGFIEADVIRWVESIWHKPRHGSRSVRIGERTVTAEVVADSGGWVSLLVRDSKVVQEEMVASRTDLPRNVEIRRKRATIEKGQPHRLTWSDEAARALLIAERLGAKPT